MRTILLMFLMASPCLALGPKYGFKDPKLDDEFTNVYKDIKSATLTRTSSVTVSGITASSITVNSITGVSLGKVLQVLYYTTTTSSSTASSSFVPTNSAGTITPSSTGSRVLACSFGVVADAGGSQGAQLAIFRGTTNLCDATGCSQTIHDASGLVTLPASMCVVDSPSSTSELSYSVRMLSSNSPATPVYGNGRTQTLILMEVGP